MAASTLFTLAFVVGLCALTARVDAAALDAKEYTPGLDVTTVDPEASTPDFGIEPSSADPTVFTSNTEASSPDDQVTSEVETSTTDLGTITLHIETSTVDSDVAAPEFRESVTDPVTGATTGASDVDVQSTTDVPEDASPKNCTISPSKDLHPGHPLILQLNETEYQYLNAATEIPIGGVAVRVACPASFLLYKTKPTNRTVAGLQCIGKGKFSFDADAAAPATTATTKVAAFSLKDLTCSATAQSVSLPLPPSQYPGLARAQIGLQLGNTSDFLAAIEEVVAGRGRADWPVRWAKARVASAIASREVLKTSTVAPAYRAGSFFQGLVMADVYSYANQRAAFLETFNGTVVVDKYLNETEGRYFVQGQLVSREDLFYESQQDAAYVYDNVVPVWQAVVDGNWRLVGDLVRSIANRSAEALDIWSGAHGQLYLDGAEDEVEFVELTHGVQPPRFLYKYVHDEASNEGLVFVTLNNPYAERVTSRDIICDKYSACDIQYPEFGDLSRGYTYCCRLEDFRFYASVFGLPGFPEAAPFL